MRSKIIESIENYSKVMIERDIKVVKEFNFKQCKTSSIVISTKKYNLKFLISIEEESLRKLSEYLFGIIDENLFEDLQKELVNTIGGYFADNYYQKDYTLSIPKIENLCDTKYSIFFSNDILRMSVKLLID